MAQTGENEDSHYESGGRDSSDPMGDRWNCQQNLSLARVLGRQTLLQFERDAICVGEQQKIEHASNDDWEE
jgi:hypothetical protein